MKETKKKVSTESLLKLIPILYEIIFMIVLFLLLFCSGVSYHLKRNFIISNIFVLIPVIVIFIVFYKFYKDTEISQKKFKIILITLFIITAVLQIVLTYNIYFYTDWDVKVIREIVDYYINTGTTKGDFYLSIYPNNVLLTAILAFLKKIPFIGKNYLTTLIFNATLVNISGILAALAIKNLKGAKLALLSYIIMLPLILLSPWIVIPYTDTFALPCVTAIVYLYSKDKKYLDYILIGLISYIGYKIKPTVIIVLIAIVIVEALSNIKKVNKNTIKDYGKKIAVFLVGIVLGLSIVKMSKIYLKFEPMQNVSEITFIHYLAMGQNDETLGSYSQQDVDDTINFGKRYDLTKFKNRVLSRDLLSTIKFYSKKTILNFNDGSFSWGTDGVFFYEKTDVPNEFSKVLREFYYAKGKYYDVFIQIQNYLWLMVLIFCPFVVKKENNKKEFVIMLAIIGLVLFLTIFEPRTRYMYCYSEIYVIAAMLGICNLKDNILNRKKVKSQ